MPQRIEDLESECSTLKTDVRERDVKIFDRDQRISSLKAESQQLAKFKFVLEYKLDAVKSQLEPKETEIAALEKKKKVYLTCNIHMISFTTFLIMHEEEL